MIRCDPDVYNGLEKLKQPGDTFSEVIARLIKTVGAGEIIPFRAIKVSEVLKK
jgi:predicted CopG family antitoxin